MDIVQEESNDGMTIEKEFIAYTNKKEEHKHRKKIPKGKEKSEMKKQWEKIKDKMDKLVRSMDELNLESIKYHAQEIDILCSKRNMEELKPRRVKKDSKKKNDLIKKQNIMNWDCGNKILNGKQ